MFKTIAEKVGTDLTNKNWQKAVDSYGKIDLVPTDIASLCKGKYEADDAFRLVKFDSTIGESGDWKPVTTVEDASGGKCSRDREEQRHPGLDRGQSVALLRWIARSSVPR